MHDAPTHTLSRWTRNTHIWYILEFSGDTVTYLYYKPCHGSIYFIYIVLSVNFVWKGICDIIEMRCNDGDDYSVISILSFQARFVRIPWVSSEVRYSIYSTCNEILYHLSKWILYKWYTPNMHWQYLMTPSLTLRKFNPSMDKQLHPLYSVWWNYLPIPHFGGAFVDKIFFGCLTGSVIQNGRRDLVRYCRDSKPHI